MSFAENRIEIERAVAMAAAEVSATTTAADDFLAQTVSALASAQPFVAAGRAHDDAFTAAAKLAGLRRAKQAATERADALDDILTAFDEVTS